MQLLGCSNPTQHPVVVKTDILFLCLRRFDKRRHVQGPEQTCGRPEQGGGQTMLAQANGFDILANRTCIPDNVICTMLSVKCFADISLITHEILNI